MKIANPADCEVRTDDHPTGALGIRYLLQGESNTPENYSMMIAENLKRFEMVRHRHNFDQFRFTLKGDMAMGNGSALREGELGYFPEGTPYGPQADDAGRIAFVLQFGGPSGYGYMTPEQYRAGRAELEKAGKFEGPVYVRRLADGRVKKTFSINAIWEQAIGTRMLIPAPRYDQPIFMDPRAYRWVPVREARGVSRKLLGTFSERGVAAEIFRLAPGARMEVPATDAARLYFVLEGTGDINGARFGTHFGIEVERREQATFVASAETTLLAFVMPPVNVEAEDADIAPVEPVPGESVAEDAA